jgi:hypothetical protein
MRNPRLKPLKQRMTAHQLARREQKMTERSRLGQAVEAANLQLAKTHGMANYSLNALVGFANVYRRDRWIAVGANAANVIAVVYLVGRVNGWW